MNRYYTFTILVLVVIILYALYKLYVYYTNSYSSSNSRILFREKPLEGGTYLMELLDGFNVNDKLTIGFLIAPMSPEFKYNEIKHIFSLTSGSFELPATITAGTKIERNNMIDIVHNQTPLNQTQQTCENLLLIDNPEVKSYNFILSSYISEDAKSIVFNVSTDGERESITNYDIRYGEPQIYMVEIDGLALNIYVNGKLADSKNLKNRVAFDALGKNNLSIVKGICDGFYGYIYHLQTWPYLLEQNDKEKFSKNILKKYQSTIESDTQNSYPMVKCSLE